MTGEMMLQLGRALALVFKLAPNGGRVPRVLIGKDTRRSGYMLEDALAAGLCSMGVNVLQVGPIPTPGLAFLTVDMRCDAGAMITASHNPFEDNGVKFFSRDGWKLPDDAEARIEALMDSPELESRRALGADIGSARRIDDASGRYIVFLKKTFPRQHTLEGCASRSTARTAPRTNGANCSKTARRRPSATSPTARTTAAAPCTSTAAFARGARADVALPSMATRTAAACDERGEIVDGEQVVAMCALDMKQRQCAVARRRGRRG
jgi:phosphoglucosamine mutase